MELYFPAPSGMESKDPRWIGAWWIGYVAVGIALVIPSILMYLFPTDKLPTADEEEEKHMKAMKNENADTIVPLITKNGDTTPIPHVHHNRATSQKIIHEISSNIHDSDNSFT